MSTEPVKTRYIGSHDLASSVMIIAEIGNNHEGDAGVAREMISAAAEAGADAVKFQTIEPARLVAADQEARLQQLGRFELSRGDFEALAAHANSAGVQFLSTPFHIDAVEWLAPLVPAFKIASGDCTYTRLLEAVSATGKPILLSTGAATLDEARDAVATIERARPDEDPGTVVLHCVVSYPTQAEDANLSAITDLARLGKTVGYSDHTVGSEAAVLSVAMGVRVIEKHFTLDNAYSDFRDHALSANPADMAALVKAVRRAEMLIGSGGKRVLPVEAEVRDAVRRSVHAARDLAAGTVLTNADTICLRPGDGIAPAREQALAGRTLTRAVAAGHIISEDDLT